MGPGRDRTRDPWICSQTRICCQTRYRLRYAARLLAQEHNTVCLEKPERLTPPSPVQHSQGSKNPLDRSYLRVPQAAGQVKLWLISNVN